MQNEIVKLLKKEGKLSEKTIDEISNIEIGDFSDLVRELGKEETEHIKRDEISKNLNTKYIGKDIYIFNEVMSTNTIAKFLSMNGVGNGAVVISEKQTKARGRSGKNWESPLGGVWLSIILNPNVNHSKIPLITLATGVAVENTLKRIGVKNAEIKWPNDILIHGKKVCGILTEAITSFNTIESVIIGVGIDANISIENFPEELRENMTTLNDEIGVLSAEISKDARKNFEKWYEGWMIINKDKNIEDTVLIEQDSNRTEDNKTKETANKNDEDKDISAEDEDDEDFGL